MLNTAAQQFRGWCREISLMERGSADLARSLRDVVRHGEDLLGVLVEEQVVITKVASAHVEN
jgi:hypothetical protein